MIISSFIDWDFYTQIIFRVQWLPSMRQKKWSSKSLWTRCLRRWNITNLVLWTISCFSFAGERKGQGRETPEESFYLGAERSCGIKGLTQKLTCMMGEKIGASKMAMPGITKVYQAMLERLGKPKRPLTGYMLFSKDRRARSDSSPWYCQSLNTFEAFLRV